MINKERTQAVYEVQRVIDNLRTEVREPDTDAFLQRLSLVVAGEEAKADHSLAPTSIEKPCIHALCKAAASYCAQEIDLDGAMLWRGDYCTTHAEQAWRTYESWDWKKLWLAYSPRKKNLPTP